MDRAIRKQAPFHPASAIAIVLSDCLIFAVTLIAGFDSFALVTTLVALGAGASVAFIEHTHDESAWQYSAGKALVAAMAVGVPFPVAGTLLGVASLLWTAWAKQPPSRVSGPAAPVT